MQICFCRRIVEDNVRQPSEGKPNGAQNAKLQCIDYVGMGSAFQHQKLLPQDFIYHPFGVAENP